MSEWRAGGRRLAARFVMLDAERVLAPGELVWDAAGRLRTVRRARGPVADLCVIPGLVNAHAHLQLAPLASPPRSFLPWVGAVMAARAATTAADERRHLRAAIASMVAGGATAVGDIDSSGLARREAAAAGLAGRSYRELTGFHLDAQASRALLRVRREPAVGDLAAGWSPHAPYSVSAALFRAARQDRRQLAVHCAELPEEQQFLRDGDGPFRELLQRLGRLPADFRAPGVGAVRWLELLGLLRPGTQLVHCQELERGDVGRIARSGASIVVCPGTMAFFGRTPPDVPRWLAAGIPVGLGTDSLASNTGLSLQHELQRAAAMWPALGPADLLAMATTHGAEALGRPGLGRLRRGGRADFVVLPATGAGAAMGAFAAFVAGTPPLAVCLRGRWQRSTAGGGTDRAG